MVQGQGQSHPTHIARRRPATAAGRTATAAALVVLAVTVAGLATTRFRRVRVAGDSMLPGIRPGDRLLVGPPACIRPGTVVALEDPRSPGRLMVKRVHSLGPSWVDVRGDNQPASTDSRQFGPIPRRRLAGRIVYRYGPSGRTGWWPGRTSRFLSAPTGRWRQPSRIVAHAIGPGD